MSPVQFQPADTPLKSKVASFTGIIFLNRIDKVSSTGLPCIAATVGIFELQQNFLPCFAINHHFEDVLQTKVETVVADCQLNVSVGPILIGFAIEGNFRRFVWIYFRWVVDN